jgi:hypothetical protein
VQTLAEMIKTLHNSQLHSLQPEWLKVKMKWPQCLIQTTTMMEKQRCSFINSYPKHLMTVTGWLWLQKLYLPCSLQRRLCWHRKLVWKYFLIIKPTSCTNFSNGKKLYMFQTIPLSIIRSFSLYTQQWYMSYRFADILILLLESCLQTCMTYTIAECTVKNS